MQATVRRLGVLAHDAPLGRTATRHVCRHQWGGGTLPHPPSPGALVWGGGIAAADELCAAFGLSGSGLAAGEHASPRAGLEGRLQFAQRM